MIMGLLDIQKIIIVFLFFLAVFGIIYIMSRGTKGSKEKSKSKIYACGENIRPENMNVPQESFYNTLIKALRLKKLSYMHSGSLTDYMFWIITGMVVLIILLVALW